MQETGDNFKRVEAESPPAVEKKQEKPYNPKVGIPMVLLSMLCFCISRSCAKYLFEAYPEMSTFQFMFIRATTAFLFNAVMINTGLKHVMYDSVQRKDRCALIIRITIANVAIFTSFSAIKYFPLSYCAAVKDIAPFFTLIFSAVCLAEPPSIKQALILTAVVALSMAFVLTGADSSEDEAALRDASTMVNVFAWFCLMSTPLLAAVISALNRALRDLNDNTVSVYANFTQMLVVLIPILALGQQIGIFMQFRGVEWLAVFGCAIFHVFSQKTNFRATQNLPLPARLPLNVTSVLFQIVIDTLMFSVNFSSIQVGLIFGIVAFKVYELSFYYCYEIPRLAAEKQRALEEKGFQRADEDSSANKANEMK